MSCSEVSFRESARSDAEAVASVYRAAIQSVYPGRDTAIWAQDLADIGRNYVECGGIFLVGVEKDADSGSELVIATGGLQKVSEVVAEIKRVSVTPTFKDDILVGDSLASSNRER